MGLEKSQNNSLEQLSTLLLLLISFVILPRFFLLTLFFYLNFETFFPLRVATQGLTHILCPISLASINARSITEMLACLIFFYFQLSHYV